MRRSRNLIAAVRELGVRDLTVVSNNAGIDTVRPGVLLQTRQIRKTIFLLRRREQGIRRQYLAGELELEFNPQGTLAERMRAGGAGILVSSRSAAPATLVAEGKETALRERRVVCLETGYLPISRSSRPGRATREGNLIYRKTSRNFNPNMATAGRITVAEVEDLVEPGILDPDHIHTPGYTFSASSHGSPIKRRSKSARFESARRRANAVVS